jgi:hypothetical protein
MKDLAPLAALGLVAFLVMTAVIAAIVAAVKFWINLF